MQREYFLRFSSDAKEYEDVPMILERFEDSNKQESAWKRPADETSCCSGFRLERASEESASFVVLLFVYTPYVLKQQHQGKRMLTSHLQHRRLCLTRSKTTMKAYKLHQDYVSYKGRTSKRENEDRIKISSSLLPSFLSSNQPIWASVFDGHQGTFASSTAAKRVHSLTHSSPLWRQLTKAGNESLDAVAEVGMELFADSYAKVDNEIRKSGKKDGTTALVACFTGPYLLLANAGDSRAVLCRNNQAVRLTQDHNLTRNPAERRRVSSRGGMVMEDGQGVYRVMLSQAGLGSGLLLKGLQTSRGLGDAEYKEMGVDIISEPDVTTVELQPDEDSFVICASDGLWTFVPDQEAVDVVNKRLRGKGANKGSAKAAADDLAALALRRGSEDDVSVVISLLDW